MKKKQTIQCTQCHRIQSSKKSFRCQWCFAPVTLVYDYEALRSLPLKQRIVDGPPSLWRYQDFLPVQAPVCGWNAGWTPLRPAPRLAQALGVRPDRLFLKDDTVNQPTLSYKDRVVPVALSAGMEQGFQLFGCASTGNLAHAVAAHAAAIGVPSFVLVPSSIEEAKLSAIAAYPTLLIRVDGTYDDINTICSILIESSEHIGIVNGNLRPWYAEGAKTMGYEIAEQLGWRLPQHIIAPVAGATLLPRIWKAIGEMKLLNLVPDALCRLHAAQARGCAPVVRALQSGAESITPVRPDTIAHSIAIGDPADGGQALRSIRESKGTGAMVSDEEIAAAIQLVARTEGLTVEPAGGTTVAAYRSLLENGTISSDELTVVCLTGNGIKTPNAVHGNPQSPPIVRGRLHAAALQVTKLIETLVRV